MEPIPNDDEIDAITQLSFVYVFHMHTHKPTQLHNYDDESNMSDFKSELPVHKTGSEQ